MKKLKTLKTVVFSIIILLTSKTQLKTFKTARINNPLHSCIRDF